MSEITSREEAMAQIMEGLRYIEQSTRRDEWPIPIDYDRDGLHARHYTLKEWILKINEETLELANELLSVASLDQELSNAKGLAKPAMWAETKRLILGEACDIIEVVFSLLNQVGFSREEIKEGIQATNKKLKERGCIEK